MNPVPGKTLPLKYHHLFLGSTGGRADHSQWVGTRASAPSSDAEGWTEDQFESALTR